MRHRARLLPIALIVALLAGVVPAGAEPQGGATSGTPSAASASAVRAAGSLDAPDNGTVLVKYRGWAAPEAVALVHGAQTGQGVGPAAARTTALRPLHGRSAKELAAELSVDPAIEWAVPDYLRQPTSYTSSPNDPYFTDSTAYLVRTTGVDIAVPYLRSWAVRPTFGAKFTGVWPYLTSDGATVAYHARAAATSFPVAVIDTGLFSAHPDKGTIVAGYDLYQSYSSAGGYTTDADVTPPTYPFKAGASVSDTEDFRSHGTAVAAAISAGTNNGIGMAGATYDTMVRVYKVAGNNLDTGLSDMPDDRVIAAIDRAVADGARVINMSLGGTVPDPALQDAIDRAWSSGVVVVAASGNDGVQGVYYPAANNHVIAVGADTPSTTPQGMEWAYFSNWGPELDLLAPGDYVLSAMDPAYTVNGVTGYQLWRGTSLASPYVAAAAATVLRFMPDLSADEVAGVLTGSAVDLGDPGWDSLNGWGGLDMTAAYQRLKADYPALVAPSVNATLATANPTVPVSWVPVSGYHVTYDVTLDGTKVLSDTSSTSMSFSLANGVHTLTVQAKSPRNWWGTYSATTVNITVDSSVPAAPAVAVAGHVVTWTTTETAPFTSQLRLDGGAPVTVSGTAYDVGNSLTEGPHTVDVRIVDRVSNVGPWGSAAFDYTLIPAVPVLGSALTTYTADAHLDWPNAQYATSYEVVASGFATQTVAASEATISPLPYGATTVKVRSLRGPSASAWSTVGITRVHPPIAVDRLAGANRYDVSYAVSAATYSKADTVVIVTGENWPDALAAGVLARAKHAPVLLTRTAYLSSGALLEAQRLGARYAIIVGGTGSVSTTVARSLTAAGLGVTRIAGPDRYTTAALVADAVKQAYGGSVPDGTAFVTSGEVVSDALIASSVAARTGYPLLLVNRRMITDATSSRLASLGVTRTVAVGTTTWVTPAVFAQLPGGVRLSGATPYSASVAVAEWSAAFAGGSLADVSIASGLTTKYADSLVGGPYVAASGGVLLLVPGTLGSTGVDFFNAHRAEVSRVHILGGSASVSDSVASYLGLLP